MTETETEKVNVREREMVRGREKGGDKEKEIQGIIETDRVNVWQRRYREALCVTDRESKIEKVTEGYRKKM